ncbi:hormogonium polysaccharide biosynthesis protein HpsL [Leptothoe sp. PORK10 BA2]|uniref:hormogonium polysaccharide biosynthesis protein HpsL n=1 Tax=Leptothoe sp. PORK10 BA2 TaxID=3110254 RepID=UPI002B1FCA24|nr:hormogonium polysaccharide biosynthesis protein HpsL [Leptothoe sp. PORK10 BA2]MEA5464026.1 hormogonium polysaccharide biosynthesis protein HpsL [Leptothoe sp. PORK10 BA2]
MATKKRKKQSQKRSKKRSTAKVQPSPEQELSRKEQRAKEREVSQARAQLIQFTILAFVFSGVVGLLLGVVVEPTLGVAATAGLLCLSLSFKYQRQALYAFIIYIPFSGTVTYMLGGNSLLQLAKDAFYIPALIGVIQMCRKKRLDILLPQAVKAPMVLVLAMVFMNLFLVNLPQQIEAGDGENPMMMGILGLKILLGYLPIITCIYYLMRTSKDLYFLLRIQAVLVITACALGFVQYLMLKTGVCAGTEGTGAAGVDLFKASLQSRCFVGGALLYSPSQGQIRLPGTFVAPWQWGWFLISSAFFSFGTAFNDRSPFWRLLGIISLITVFVMAVVSGQRIALFLVPAIVVLLSVLTGQVTNLKRFVPIGVIMGLILVVLTARNPELLQERVDSFEARWNASPPHEFVMQQFDEVWKSQNGILGNGVARATNGARIFGEIRLVETYHPKLLYELGPLGLLAIMLMYTSITVATFKAYRKTKDKNLRGYAASMWVFVLFISYFPYYYPLDVEPVSVYYWLAAGIVLKIPTLDKQERELANPTQSRRLRSRKKATAPTPEDAPQPV